MSKLLVATGQSNYGSQGVVEVIDLDNPSKTCVLQDFPNHVTFAVGGLTSSGPMVCGGYYAGYGESADCYTLRRNGQFVKISGLTMNVPRKDASSIVTVDGKLMINGGWNNWEGYSKWSTLFGKQSTEIINVAESTIEAGFIYGGIYEHCIVRINATTAMILGGSRGEWRSDSQNSTYFIDLETLQATRGPEMQEARSDLGCAFFEHNQQNFVIAAGGKEWRSHTNSAEILHLDSTSLRWSKGNTTKIKLTYSLKKLFSFIFRTFIACQK